jgi:hypothetical protein
MYAGDGSVREALCPGGRLLDVATGTGDVAFEALRNTRPRPRHRRRLHVADDIRQSGGPTIVGALGGVDLCLFLPDNTFDALASAFLMRNVIDVWAALTEQRRDRRRPGAGAGCARPPTPSGSVFASASQIVPGSESNHRSARRLCTCRSP